LNVRSLSLQKKNTMSRPKKQRKIDSPPLMQGFRPFGVPMCKSGSVKLTFEEYESFKLVSYNDLAQEEAALQMNISRPTLTRVYNRALKAIAQAFAEGKTIEIEGGNYEFESKKYRCNSCFHWFEDETERKRTNFIRIDYKKSCNYSAAINN